MAEGKILSNPVHVRAAQELRVAEPAPAFRILALEQVAAAGAAVENLSSAGDFESFAHRFSSLNSFGSSHTILVFLPRGRFGDQAIGGEQ